MKKRSANRNIGRNGPRRRRATSEQRREQDQSPIVTR